MYLQVDFLHNLLSDGNFVVVVCLFAAQFCRPKKYSHRANGEQTHETCMKNIHNITKLKDLFSVIRTKQKTRIKFIVLRAKEVCITFFIRLGSVRCGFAGKLCISEYYGCCDIYRSMYELRFPLFHSLSVEVFWNQPISFRINLNLADNTSYVTHTLCTLYTLKN